MRRTTTITVFVLFLAAIAQAAPIDCSTLLTLDQLIAANAGGGCFSQDKIFSNFVYTGGGTVGAADVKLTLVFTPSPVNGDVHGWSFNPVAGNWTVPFTLSFDITVCTSVAQGCAVTSPTATIVGSLDQMNTGSTPNATSITDTQTMGTLVLHGTNVNTETVQLDFAGQTAVHTSSVVTLGGNSVLSSYEQDFFEAPTEVTTPEPAPYFMLAGGLMLLGLASKRFKKS